MVDGPQWRGYLSETPDDIALPEHQNTLELTYALVNAVRPEQVRYEHRLQGFDRDWVDAGNRRFVRYANLKGGKYALAVRAIDSDGVVYDKELFAFPILAVSPAR